MPKKLYWMQKQEGKKYHITKDENPICGTISKTKLRANSKTGFKSVQQIPEKHRCKKCENTYQSKSFQARRTKSQGFTL
ncbi:MAG: hypothetical protein ABEI78_02205 [Candidatus Nanohaloarchaea archaeon]